MPIPSSIIFSKGLCGTQLRHQERRKQEAQSKADEAASATPATSDYIVPANVSTGKETETVIEAKIQRPVKPVENSAV